jgi:phage tail sheath protein FI
MGAIHGREALIANNFSGFHKAAAGIDVTLPRVLKLPTGENILDEEFLNPQGINVIKKKDGNFILWGDRTVGLDSAFKFKHQREYLSHIEHILQENFDFIVFAINNAETIGIAETALTVFFLGEFDNGALDGATFPEAVRIKIDDEINTAITAAAGDLNAQIRIKIVNTVERFVISIGKAGIFESLV